MKEKNSELFVEPIDYALIKDAFKCSRTIIMSGNRGTGKTAIVFDLMRNAPQNSFVLYIDDFSSVPECPSTNDFYRLLCVNLVNVLMSRAVEIKKGISHLSKDDKLFLSQLIVNYMTTVTHQDLNSKVEKIQLSKISRFINKISSFIQFAINYGLSAAAKLFNSMFANQFSLPIIEADSAISILPEIKVMMLMQSRAAINGTPRLPASKVNMGIFVVDHAPINRKTLNSELPFFSIIAAMGNAAYSGPAAAQPKTKPIKAPLTPEPGPVYFIIV